MGKLSYQGPGENYQSAILLNQLVDYPKMVIKDVNINF